MGHWCPIDGVGPIDGVCAAIIGAGALLMVGEHTPHQWRWGGVGEHTTPPSMGPIDGGTHPVDGGMVCPPTPPVDGGMVWYMMVFCKAS